MTTEGSFPNSIRILAFIDKNGPQNFSSLVESKELKLSRNTIDKYLKILREKEWITLEYEGRKVFNHISPEGKLELETYFGKDNISSRLKAYSLFGKKIKQIRDEILTRFGPINNNQLLLDSVLYFIDFSRFNFYKKLPSEDFQYTLAYFLARYDLQNCRSEAWMRTQSSVTQLKQEEFYRKFKLDRIQLQYFANEWGKIAHVFPIYDENNNVWFLSSNSLLYEGIMEHIRIRAKRGILEELVFENFSFNVATEVNNIGYIFIKQFNLELDFHQIRQYSRFISGMMNIILEKRRGYPEPWLRLPGDSKSLLSLSLELETELNNNKVDMQRKLEIYRMLIEINNRLKNYPVVIKWGEKYLEQEPEDDNVLTIMALHYYNLEKYDKFLEIAERLRKKVRNDLVIIPLVLKYFIEIRTDLDRALGIVEDTEKFIIDNKVLMTLHPNLLYNKARIYMLKNNLDFARGFAEKAWFHYHDRKMDLFHLIVDIYSKLEEWEVLEDFCYNYYLDDHYNPDIFSSVYFAFLKRDSKIKANEIYVRVNKHFPEYIEKLNQVKVNL